MAHYPDVENLDKLWPDQGYAVIVEDSFKPPDSDDFVNMLQQFDDMDFELPPPREGYSYWVHGADGSTYTREEWEAHKETHTEDE